MKANCLQLKVFAMRSHKGGITNVDVIGPKM